MTIKCERVDPPVKPGRREVIQGILEGTGGVIMYPEAIADRIEQELSRVETTDSASTYRIEGELSAADFDALAEYGRLPMPIPPIPDALSAILAVITELAYAETIKGWAESASGMGMAGATDPGGETKQGSAPTSTRWDIIASTLSNHFDRWATADATATMIERALMIWEANHVSASTRCPGSTVTAEELAEWRHRELKHLADTEYGIGYAVKPWDEMPPVWVACSVAAEASVLAKFFPEHVDRIATPEPAPVERCDNRGSWEEGGCVRPLGHPRFVPYDSTSGVGCSTLWRPEDGPEPPVEATQPAATATPEDRVSQAVETIRAALVEMYGTVHYRKALAGIEALVESATPKAKP